MILIASTNRHAPGRTVLRCGLPSPKANKWPLVHDLIERLEKAGRPFDAYEADPSQCLADAPARLAKIYEDESLAPLLANDALAGFRQRYPKPPEEVKP